MLSHTFDVASFVVTVGLYAMSRRSDEPSAETLICLTARGVVNEPVGEVRDIEIHLYPRESVEIGTARPASIASIIQVKPHVSVVARFPHPEFDRMWAMAFASQMKFAHVAFTKPHYGNALVTSLSFSNEREE